MVKKVEKEVKLSDYVKKCLAEAVTPEEMVKLLEGVKLTEAEQKAITIWEMWH